VPVIPSFIERVVMLNLNQIPGVMLDLLGTAAFQIVIAAVRLELFEAMNSSPQTVAEIASIAQTDQRGTKALLDALVPLGYVTKQNDQYANTPLTKKWLLKDSPSSFVQGLEFWAMLLFDFWSDLDKSIRQGAPQSDLYHQWLDDQQGGWAAFQGFMETGFQSMSEEIIKKLKLPTHAQNLLDVGGGHGLYSLAFCRAYPNLSAAVFDLQGAVEVAQLKIDQEKMNDRVSVQAGDFRQDKLGSDYDVILLFNLVHTHLPEDNRRLLQKVANALNPGGMVVILEQFAGKLPGSFAKIFSSVVDVNYFHMVGGKGYTEDELAELLQEAGLTSIQNISLRSLPGNGLVWGIKAT
jgi:2-polyprenyl-3-methyl-5-hydroxy-6-metoxy-1,4-benzoquinol methylase